MSLRKDHYELSEAADCDLESLFDYTVKYFGQSQAFEYLYAFETLFEKLAENPLIGKARDEVKLGLRSIPQKEHIVFYRILKSHIRIIRVLHSSMDLPKNFKNK